MIGFMLCFTIKCSILVFVKILGDFYGVEWDLGGWRVVEIIRGGVMWVIMWGNGGIMGDNEGMRFLS